MNVGFYVTVIDDNGLTYRMRGPFASHQAALDAVIPASRAADTIDPRTAFWSWGTCKLEMANTLPLGRLDKREQAQHDRELAAEIGCRVNQLHEWDIQECVSCGLGMKVHRDGDGNGLCRYCGDALRGGA